MDRRGRKRAGAVSVDSEAVIREQCLQEFLTGTKSIPQIAAAHGVKRTTLRYWVTQAGLSTAFYRSEKIDEASDRVAEYLIENLDALRAQARILGDTDSLLTLDPERLEAIAKAHEVLAGRSFQIFEAIERGSAEAEQQRLLGSGGEEG
jgi:transposase-like protein